MGLEVVLRSDRIVAGEDVVRRRYVNDWTMPAASVATSVTSARPIISAAAVDAVRCGFRFELSSAVRAVHAVRTRHRGTRRATLDAHRETARTRHHRENDDEHDRVQERPPPRKARTRFPVGPHGPQSAVPQQPVRKQEEGPGAETVKANTVQRATGLRTTERAVSRTATRRVRHQGRSVRCRGPIPQQNLCGAETRSRRFRRAARRIRPR